MTTTKMMKKRKIRRRRTVNFRALFLPNLFCTYVPLFLTRPNRTRNE